MDGTDRRSSATGDDLSLAPGDVADYVAELTGDLARMTRETGLDFLAYLLEIARCEAETRTKRTRAPGVPREAR